MACEPVIWQRCCCCIPSSCGGQSAVASSGRWWHQAADELLLGSSMVGYAQYYFRNVTYQITSLVCGLVTSVYRGYRVWLSDAVKSKHVHDASVLGQVSTIRRKTNRLAHYHAWPRGLMASHSLYSSRTMRPVWQRPSCRNAVGSAPSCVRALTAKQLSQRSTQVRIVLAFAKRLEALAVLFNFATCNTKRCFTAVVRNSEGSDPLASSSRRHHVDTAR